VMGMAKIFSDVMLCLSRRFLGTRFLIFLWIFTSQ